MRYLLVALLILCVVPAAAQDDAPALPADEARFLRAVTYLRHDTQVIESYFEPNGHYFMAGTVGGQLYIWQAGPSDDHLRGALRLQLDDYIAGVTLTAVSPEGTLLATNLGSAGDTVRLIDIVSGEALAFSGRHNRPLKQIFFADGGRLLVTCDFDDGVRVWAVDSGELLHEFADIPALALSPPGDQLALVSADAVQLLNLTQDIAPQTILARGGRGVAFSPDGLHLAIWGDFLAVYALADGAFPFINGASQPDDVIWIPNSPYLIAQEFWTAQVFLAVSETAAAPLPLDDFGDFTARSGLSQLAVHPNGRNAVTVDGLGTARLWRIGEAGAAQQIGSLPGLIDEVAISPDSQTLVSFRRDFRTRFWRADNGDLRGERDLPETVNFHPAWALISSSANNVVTWWSLPGNDFAFAFAPVGHPRTRSNLRPTPAEEQQRLAGLDANQSIFAIARTRDSAWLEIVQSDGSTGWVFTETLVIDVDESRLRRLPVVQVGELAFGEAPVLLAAQPAAEPSATACTDGLTVVIRQQAVVDGVTYYAVDCALASGWVAASFVVVR